MRIWRNWQTRTVQVRVDIASVEVRILLSAPNKKDLLRNVFFRYAEKNKFEAKTLNVDIIRILGYNEKTDIK